MNLNERPNVKILAAVIGGSAIVATAALSTAIAQARSEPATIMGSSMTLGATSTMATPATTLITTFAVPVVKAKPAGG